MSDLEMDLLYRDSRRCPCGGWLAIECDEFGRALQYCDRCGAVSSAMRTPLVAVEIEVPARKPSGRCRAQRCPGAPVTDGYCALHSSPRATRERARKRANQQAFRARRAA
jgi:hypothetical protein